MEIEAAREGELKLAIRQFLNLKLDLCRCSGPFQVSRRLTAKMSGGIISLVTVPMGTRLRGNFIAALLSIPQNKISMGIESERIPHVTKDFWIEKAIKPSAVLITLIGERGLISRLESPDDYSRLELAAALTKIKHPSDFCTTRGRLDASG